MYYHFQVYFIYFNLCDDILNNLQSNFNSFKFILIYLYYFAHFFGFKNYEMSYIYLYFNLIIDHFEKLINYVKISKDSISFNYSEILERLNYYFLFF